jgi:4-alpha-glucanotransferase
MESMSEQAALWGIETDYIDAFGHRRSSDPDAVARLVDVLSKDAGAATTKSSVGAERSDEGPNLLPAPERAFQGGEKHPRRIWGLAVQLYGVRSRRNWGHGDFTDLAGLIELASDLGAAGVALNPLHALFDDPAEASPYSPNSRLFLNTRYIDVEVVAEFPGLSAGMEGEIAALRRTDVIDYRGVVAVKTRALGLAYEALCQRKRSKRYREFQRFRRERGPTLARFAAFEHLRSRFRTPWWEWPAEWQTPNDEILQKLRRAHEDGIAFHEYLQWIADQQLGRCRDLAAQWGMPIGLYLDLAVGVRPDGFDAWNNQDTLLRSVEIGAPPDILNTGGQKWGLAGVNPIALEKRAFEPFRDMLRASMRYAGAIRMDHVLGLQRLYLVPGGMGADKGVYVRLPFQALLAVVAQESVASKCIVIGEDLGTVPENFRETLAAWGVWSYQVMLFERGNDGSFHAPEHYRENALVTFATHDLPTFAGWLERHDLAVKRELSIDPGETDDERRAAHAALWSALSRRGMQTLDFLSVVHHLASTPSRLLVISMEDALGSAEQVNVPGTVDEHPNWRRRLPVDLEDLKRESGLAAAATILRDAGRGVDRQ